MASKIRIKVGATEIDFEGSEEYMRDELPKLVELLADFAVLGGDEEGSTELDVLPPSNDSSKKPLSLTTNSIASKLSAKSGSELVVAACAHLYFVKGAERFSRANILAEMKLASNFYKQTFNNNLSSALKQLVKSDLLLEVAQDTYALVEKERKRLETILSAT